MNRKKDSDNISEQIKEYIQPGKKNVILIYVLYLAGFLFPVLPLIGAAFSYANKSHQNKMLYTHYIFAFRSFCFCALGLFASFVATFIFIGPLIYVVVLVWFIVRSIIALQFLFQDKPHPAPLTLWIK